MEQRQIKYKGLYMVLSVLVAIVAWSYTGNVANPEESGPVRNIPVTFIGLEALEERGLTITSGAEQTVSIQVSGRRNAYRALSSETVSVVVDVSNIQQRGEHTLAYQVSYNLPPDISSSSLVITDQYPTNVSFTVSRLARREIPVQGIVSGRVADGYLPGKFSFSPSSIEVRGDEALVNQIEYALVTLDQENMTETYEGDQPYTFITFVDEPLSTAETQSLMTSTQVVRTTLPISMLKEVGVQVNLIYGNGVGKENVHCTIDPETVMISGAPEALETLRVISLGDIDLSKVPEDTTLTFPIPLADELTNVSGVSEATVDLKFTGLTTATVETSNIDLINPIEGYSARAVTRACSIQIRGSAAAVAAVTPSQVRIVADLSNAVATSGTQTIPVKVYVGSGSSVGAVGEYTIVVAINKT